jgi:hypothetical protein
MRESLLNRGGEFLIPKSEGLIGDSHVVGEIGGLHVGEVVEG